MYFDTIAYFSSGHIRECGGGAPQHPGCARCCRRQAELAGPIFIVFWYINMSRCDADSLSSTKSLIWLHKTVLMCFPKTIFEHLGLLLYYDT